MTYKNNKKISSKELNEVVLVHYVKKCPRCDGQAIMFYNGICERCIIKQGGLKDVR